ncbi:MAG: hypothetical protein R3358_04785 [Woeseiaceae bacterium]|nr:hypothetical protein [Woeseiaceae bacterium]
MAISALPVLGTVLEAYAAVFRNAAALSRALLVPMLCGAIIWALREAVDSGWLLSSLLWLVSLPFATLAAIAIHRILLLGADSLTNPWSIYWTKRETDFFWWLVILSVVSALVAIGIALVAWMFPQGIVLSTAIFLIAKYFEARLGMVLPATAVGRRMILKTSWTLTSGNGVWMAIALTVPWLIFVLLITLISAIAMQTWVGLYIFLLVPLALFTVIVDIAVLSLCYRHLETADYVPDVA